MTVVAAVVRTRTIRLFIFRQLGPVGVHMVVPLRYVDHVGKIAAMRMITVRNQRVAMVDECDFVSELSAQGDSEARHDAAFAVDDHHVGQRNLEHPLGLSLSDECRQPDLFEEQGN